MSRTIGAASGALVLALSASAATAQTLPTPTTLKMINGWTTQPFGTGLAKVEALSGVVRFKGAIATSGTSPFPFVLPSAFRPATDVYVPVDMCNATNGRLRIQPTGTVSVQAETSFSNAQCFTSLDGASFDRNTSSGTPVTLVNGWTNAPFSTSNASFRVLSGIVQLKGAIAGGTTSLAFTLPAAARPSTTVYVPIDLCNSANGRLIIAPSGTVVVQAESSFSSAQCFTSLDGASYATATTGTTPLTLTNGWVNAPFSTRNAGVRLISGVVHFTGAIGSGTSASPFTLPASVRPSKPVYVKVDLCNATNGRLYIQTNGVVTINTATFANAQCFTSLEGATYVR